MADRSKSSIPGQAAELLDLVRAYAKQETIEPLKGIARWVAFGVAGALLLGLGLVLLALGLLRALQTEFGTTFDGNWSWAPYLIVLTACALLMGLVGTRIGKRRARA